MSRKNNETRNRILNAVLKLLEMERAPNVRMSDIAKAAGISRQAVYLHFPTRAELLIAATVYLDELNDIEGRLQKSRDAKTGIERLNAYVDAWGNFIPEIYNAAKALMAMKDTDKEAELAWTNRMNAMRHGCEAVVRQLKKDGKLNPEYTATQATDMLWTILSVRNWEQLTQGCEWSQKQYIKSVKSCLLSILVRN